MRILAITLLFASAVSASELYPPARTYMMGDPMTVNPDGEIVNTYDFGNGDALTVTKDGDVYNNYNIGNGDTLTVGPNNEVYNTYSFD